MPEHAIQQKGPFAHCRVVDGEKLFELLVDHGALVGRLAGDRVAAFADRRYGEAFGPTHDVGKATELFQQRVKGMKVRVEHSGLGAALVMHCALDNRALPAAFAIAGHHAGLPNYAAQGRSNLTPLLTRIHQNEGWINLAKTIPGVLEAARIAGELPAFLEPAADDRGWWLRAEFWARMLFSAGVDADSEGTQMFMDPIASAARVRGGPSLAELLARLDLHLAQTFPLIAGDASPMVMLRREVMASCVAAARTPQGIFTLTVPVGGAKTLGSLHFALAHGVLHGLRRVFIVAPFTSIIEQTAGVCREALSRRDGTNAHGVNDAVLEHHCNVSHERCDDEPDRFTQAEEDWDIPVVVTTMVQFLETLFTNRRGRARKLHNIANSVIILDEAHRLPEHLLDATLDVLQEIVRDYGCSVVLSSATMPALQRREKFPQGLPDLREIAPAAANRANSVKKLRVEWPDPGTKLSPADLAGRLADYERVLAIVHRRKDARATASQLPAEGRFVLTAGMCPDHRSRVLEQIRERLASGNTCRVVATQLVEAGVDFSFPVVFRALAGLDSIIQASGRCNRHAEFDAIGGGLFVVFEAESRPPSGLPRVGAERTRSLLAAHGGTIDLADPRIVDTYFRNLYAGLATDPRNIQHERASLNFANVADAAQVIVGSAEDHLVAPWGEGLDRLSQFVASPSRDGLRHLQRYLVPLEPGVRRRLEAAGALSEATPGLFALRPDARKYYDDCGLNE